MPGSTVAKPTTASLLIGLVLMMTFMVAGFGGGLWGFEHLLLEHRLERDGIVATAEMIERKQHSSPTARNQTSYEVTYSFEVDGRRIRSTARIGRKLYHHLAATNELQVRYLPADPSQSWPVKAGLGWLFWLATLLGLAVGLGATVVTVGMIRSRLGS